MSAMLTFELVWIVKEFDLNLSHWDVARVDKYDDSHKIGISAESARLPACLSQ
jgi:hypothetical protein